MAIALSSEHTFTLTQAGKESLAISFRAEPGGMATLTSPIKVKDVTSVVISSLASSARLYASDTSLKGGLKDCHAAAQFQTKAWSSAESLRTPKL